MCLIISEVGNTVRVREPTHNAKVEPQIEVHVFVRRPPGRASGSPGPGLQGVRVLRQNLANCDSPLYASALSLADSQKVYDLPSDVIYISSKLKQ